MVQSLNQTGLRVVMDVVYNHTNAAGQADKSVLDRIVPGYYHRLLDDGTVANSTCCANTATEHAMMEKLMVDSIVTWARDYKVDGFRFDLMGHHSKANMLAVRAALDELTLAEDGVDGSKIYVYGEGWNFGEVANNARFVQATQLEMDGTGIGTFNDRLRDAVRGGGPFDGDQRQNQGFGSGLYTDPNEFQSMSPADQKARLLLLQDQIKAGLTGNLKDFEFVDWTGALVTVPRSTTTAHQSGTPPTRRKPSRTSRHTTTRRCSTSSPTSSRRTPRANNERGRRSSRCRPSRSARACRSSTPARSFCAPSRSTGSRSTRATGSTASSSMAAPTTSVSACRANRTTAERGRTSARSSRTPRSGRRPQTSPGRTRGSASCSRSGRRHVSSAWIGREVSARLTFC
jgi:hypothetical protein